MPWTKILGMIEDLICKLRHNKILPEQLAKFLKGENPFEPAKQIVLRGINALVEEWVKFYKEVFKLDVDFSNLQIPAKGRSFNWLIIMLQNLTAQNLYDMCKELFKAWKWTDKSLDDVLDQTKSSRNPANGTYAIWVRDRVEADEELKSLSADDLKQKNIQGITLEERLLLELFFYWKTKKHLDINNWTLCSGSRFHDGGVPGVDWNRYSDGLGVGWDDSDDADGGLRSRQAVS